MTNSPNTTPLPRKWNELSLRAKLVIILLMVAFIPLVVVVLFNDRNARQAAEVEADEKLLRSAASIAAQLDNFIQTGLDTARYQAHLPVVLNYMQLPAAERLDSAEEENLRDFILTASYENPVYITSIAVLDMDGNTLIDTSAAEVGVSNGERVYFRRAIETGLLYASSVEYDHITGKPSLYFAAPIQNAEDKFIGVLRIRYDALILQDMVAQNNGRAGENSFAMLLDENHVHLANGAERESIHKTVAPLSADLVERLQAERLLPLGNAAEISANLSEFEKGLSNFAEQPTFAAELQSGKTQRIAVAKLKAQQWLAAFAQPEAVIFAPVNARMRISILTALLSALVVALLGLILAEALAESVIRLTNEKASAKQLAPPKAPQPAAPTAPVQQDYAPVKVAVTGEESALLPSRRQQQTEEADDKLEVAIRRLGNILSAARVSTEGHKDRHHDTPS